MKLKKIIDHKDITTQKCDKLTAEKFAASLAQANLASNIVALVKMIDFDD